MMTLWVETCRHTCTFTINALCFDWPYSSVFKWSTSGWIQLKCQMKFKSAGKCYYKVPVLIISLLFLALFELANAKFWCPPLTIGKTKISVFVNNQLDTQFLFHVCLFIFSTCFGQPCAHHQENQLYQYDIWYMSLCIDDRLVCRFGWDAVSSKPAHQTVIYVYTEWHIPDVVLINLFSWWWAHGCPKHVENINKHTLKRNCVSSWLFTKIIPRCTVNRTYNEDLK